MKELLEEVVAAFHPDEVMTPDRVTAILRLRSLLKDGGWLSVPPETVDEGRRQALVRFMLGEYAKDATRLRGRLELLAEAEEEAFEKFWPTVGQTIGKVAAREAWLTRAALAVEGPKPCPNDEAFCRTLNFGSDPNAGADEKDGDAFWATRGYNARVECAPIRDYENDPGARPVTITMSLSDFKRLDADMTRRRSAKGGEPFGGFPARPPEPHPNDDGPGAEDGHTWQGFPGGCTRMGCPADCSPFRIEVRPVDSGKFGAFLNDVRVSTHIADEQARWVVSRIREGIRWAVKPRTRRDDDLREVADELCSHYIANRGKPGWEFIACITPGTMDHPLSQLWKRMDALLNGENPEGGPIV